MESNQKSVAERLQKNLPINWKLNYTLLNNPQAKMEISKENLKYTEMDFFKTHNIPNLWNKAHSAKKKTKFTKKAARYKINT